MALVRWGLLMAICSMLGVTAFAASTLVGTRWRVEITPEGATIPHHIDQIRFQEENFASAIFERKGFQASSYLQGKSPEGNIMWDASQKSESEGDLLWHGEIKGDTMTGTLVWKQPDGKFVKHTLAGTPSVDEPAAPAEGAAKGAAGAKTGSKWGCSLVVD
ncbi:MAG: hypothetical protein HY543_00015 [Deltaproteobacteria bacterium]|nr:hypothetical protein [Deltaproteobacteria bacterium]